MEFFFVDPNVVRQPPEKTRFTELRGEPDPDGRRIRVFLELTPFLQRPNIDLRLDDASGEEAGSTSIVEPVAWKLELTLHNRKPGSLPGSYTLTASLLYPDHGEVDRRQILIQIQTPDSSQ